MGGKLRRNIDLDLQVAAACVVAGGLSITSAADDALDRAPSLAQLRDETRELGQIAYEWAAMLRGNQPREGLAALLRRAAEKLEEQR